MSGGQQLDGWVEECVCCGTEVYKAAGTASPEGRSGLERLVQRGLGRQAEQILASTLRHPLKLVLYMGNKDVL